MVGIAVIVRVASPTSLRPVLLKSRTLALPVGPKFLRVCLYPCADTGLKFLCKKLPVRCRNLPAIGAFFAVLKT